MRKHHVCPVSRVAPSMDKLVVHTTALELVTSGCIVYDNGKLGALHRNSFPHLLSLAELSVEPYQPTGSHDGAGSSAPELAAVLFGGPLPSCPTAVAVPAPLQ